MLLESIPELWSEDEMSAEWRKNVVYRKFTECAGQHIPVLAGLVDLLGELVEESAILQALTPATTATPTLDSQVCHKKSSLYKASSN